MSSALAKIDFDQEQLATIDALYFPQGVSAVERNYCFSVARELGLNPITKEIYFVPRRSKVGERWLNKIEPMVGRDGFLSIAHRSSQLAGIESSCSIKEVPHLENGEWVTKADLVAECVVYRKDSKNKYVGQVNYSEYVQTTQEGKPTKFWAEKPETMLKKVAESQALRKAFNIHGVYCPEEMGAGYVTDSGDIVTQSIEAEYTRIDPDGAHLSIVNPTQPKTAPVSTVAQPKPPVPPPAAIPPKPITPAAPASILSVPSPPSPPPYTPMDEEGWPDPPPPKNNKEVVDAVALEIIALLNVKHIAHDVIIDGVNGLISANSFDEKELLKSSGFRWSPNDKRWVYKFKNEPF